MRVHINKRGLQLLIGGRVLPLCNVVRSDGYRQFHHRSNHAIYGRAVQPTVSSWNMFARCQ